MGGRAVYVTDRARLARCGIIAATQTRADAMIDNFSNSQTFRKPAVVSGRGIVAAQHVRAAQAGADMLAAGGDCVDAVVATSFALGVVEPWMSGIGGGGTMVLYRAKEQAFEVIDFGMRSPAGLDAADYPLTGAGAASDLFPWRQVRDDRNIHGPGSVAVPGVVAGMETAHRRHARMPWRDLLAPAVALAGEGLLVDWFMTELIATGAPDLRRYPASAARFLVDGLPPVAMWGIRNEVRLPQASLAATLLQLADQGPRDFYAGDLAKRIAADMRAGGGALSAADLARYQVRASGPLAIPYRGGRVFATPELSAGPTLAHTLRLLEASAAFAGKKDPDAAVYTAYGQALQTAYRERLKGMGDAAGKRALGAEHLAPSCTSHFSVVDAQGNMAAVTQTLLSIFGSKFVLPDTGILMNNGIMWFDPVPGGPNSLAPERRCLCNYTPVIAGAADGRMLALGASGGRRILPAVTQLLSFTMDFGMDLDTAFHAPRIDASEGDTIIGDVRLPEAVRAGLAACFDYAEARVQTMPMKFACPSAVMRDGVRNSGATETMHPWADAVAG